MTNVFPGITLQFQNYEIVGYPKPTASYQWYRNSVPISGETAETYVVTIEDAFTDISFIATVSNLFNTSNFEYLLGVTVYPEEFLTPPSFLSTPSPSIVGAAVGDTVFIENTGATGVPDPTVTFNWLLNGVTIQGATGSSYTTTATGNLLGFILASNITGSTSAYVNFGTIVDEIDGPELDWDTYEDGIYTFPAAITSTPTPVSIIDSPETIPQVVSVFLDT